MNVILTVPGSPGAPGVHLEDKFAFPVESLGLGYLAAMLQAHDIEVEIVDGYADRLTWQETVANILQRAEDDSIVGISVLQSTAPAARLTAQAVRQAGCNSPIVLGGWLGSAAPLELMSYIPEADYLLLGEAEHTFLELVSCLKDNRRLDHIPGLLARRSADDYKVNPAVPTVAAMDTLPLPYHYLPVTTDGPPLAIQSSRGCYWGACSFCSTAGQYKVKHWRARSVESVLAEMQHVYETLGATSLCFVDDEFFGPCPEGFSRAERLVEALTAAPLPLRFAIDCLVGDVRLDLFERLTSVGLQQVFLGIESGSPTSLQRFRKGFKVDQAIRSVRCLEALGLRVVTGFIGFEPYMQLEDVRGNIDFLLDDLQHRGNPAKHLRRLIPIHGTPMWHRLKADGLLMGEFPEWEFRFKDSRVETLYHTLSQASRPICDEYLEKKLYQASTEEQVQQCQILNQNFKALFEEIYPTVA